MLGATLEFGCISNTRAADCAIGAAQVRVEVIDAGSSMVLFEFHNDGPAASSIADVYFDDGALLSIAAVINATGVQFSQLATPGELPAANDATSRRARPTRTCSTISRTGACASVSTFRASRAAAARAS